MIRLWTVLDLDVFRRYENDSGVRREQQDNGDGTYFIAYDIQSFPPELVAAASPLMLRAFEHGVQAIERLREKHLDDLDERWRQRLQHNPPPDLQEWVQRFGGYNNIPWSEWDKAVCEYQVRRREMD